MCSSCLLHFASIPESLGTQHLYTKHRSGNAEAHEDGQLRDFSLPIIGQAWHEAHVHPEALGSHSQAIHAVMTPMVVNQPPNPSLSLAPSQAAAFAGHAQLSSYPRLRPVGAHGPMDVLQDNNILIIFNILRHLHSFATFIFTSNLSSLSRTICPSGSQWAAVLHAASVALYLAPQFGRGQGPRTHPQHYKKRYIMLFIYKTLMNKP